MKSIKIALLAVAALITAGLKAQDMETQVIQKVKQVFESTDARNWEQVKAAFAESVLLDYTSMAGGEPSTLSPDQIVTSWKGVLPGFDQTRHMVYGFIVSTEGNKAQVTHQGTANHYLDGEVWTVVGDYEHELTRTADGWQVSAMKFNMKFIDGNNDLPRLAMEKLAGKPIDNKAVVNRFFEALETQNFDWLEEVFAEEGRQLNPYIPEGFPKSFDGREAIYQQYRGLTENFGQMRFPRELYTTEDPDLIFVKFRGEIEIKAGGQYANDYLGLFRLKDGLIIEYTEFFNPIVMAKAFNLKLD